MKRGEAKAMGLVRYNNGKPCPKGHSGERFVSTGHCTECLLQNARKWRDENPDKVRSYTKKYRRGRENVLNAKSRDWHEKNRSRHLELNRKWHKENPDSRRVHESLRRARARNSSGTFKAADIKNIMRNQEYLCVYCKTYIGVMYHIDHKTPLARGGTNDLKNIQILCPPCNHKKHTKSHTEYLQHLNKEKAL